MPDIETVAGIIQNDPWRWHLLGIVRTLCLADGWVAAGFVRNAVWDHLHGRPPTRSDADVDVIWFDFAQATPSVDQQHEAALRIAEPAVRWSVKNQARMHRRNGDAPYASATDAMRFWPETATAVAVRRTEGDTCEIAAPFGLSDLLSLILRPTPRFAVEKRVLYAERQRAKDWMAIHPLLRAL